MLKILKIHLPRKKVKKKNLQFILISAVEVLFVEGFGGIQGMNLEDLKINRLWVQN